MSDAFLSIVSAWAGWHWSLQLLLLAALFVGAALMVEAPQSRFSGWALVGALGLACAMCMSAGQVAVLHASWAMLGAALCLVLLGRYLDLPLMGLVVLLALFVVSAGSVGALFNDAASELLHVKPAAAQLALMLLSALLIAPCVLWGLTHRAPVPALPAPDVEHL